MKMLILSVKNIPLLIASTALVFVHDNIDGLFRFKNVPVFYYREENIEGSGGIERGDVLNPFTQTYYDIYKDCINENLFSDILDIGFMISKKSRDDSDTILKVRYQLYDEDFLPCEKVVLFKKGQTVQWYNVTLEEDYYDIKSPFYLPNVSQLANNNIHIEFGDFQYTNVSYLVLTVKVSWTEDYMLSPFGTNLGYYSECIVVYKI